MKNSNFIYLFILMLILCLSFVSSNFVCGFVKDSKGFSSSWAEVRVYFEENTSDFTNCKVNPENKYCCDLENISSVDFDVGKKVFAEIIEEKEGLIAGPVSLYLTDAGYDIFPDMKLEKAILVNYPRGNVFVNESSVPLNISLSKKYNNLKYSVNSSERYTQGEICENCNYSEFSIPLFKGKNEILLFSNDEREILERIVLYNLDYFNFEFDIYCDKCKQKRKFFYIPSGEEVVIKSSFNSSHHISGDFLFYFPSNWVFSDSSRQEDFSVSHNAIKEEIINKKEFSAEYILKTPSTFFKKDYIFHQNITEYSSQSKVRVFKFKFIPFHSLNNFKASYFESTPNKKASPKEPIVIYSNEDYLKLVALFPKEEIYNIHSSLIYDAIKTGKKKEYSFRIISNIPLRDIETILLIFKLEKGEEKDEQSIQVYSNNKEIKLDFYEEDEYFAYYSTYVKEKGPFNVKIS